MAAQKHSSGIFWKASHKISLEKERDRVRKVGEEGIGRTDKDIT